jgi:hypothetical protein
MATSDRVDVDNSNGESPDWSDEKAGQLVDLIDTVKGRTTDNMVMIARALVYGLVISVLVIASVIILVIVLIRMADAYLPIGSGVGDAVWAAHAFIGGLTSVLGLGAWLSRRGEGSPKPLIMAAVVDGLVILAIVVYGSIQAFT